MSVTWHVLGMKYGANCGFLGPICFRGHFEKISIAKVLLGTKQRRVGKFCGCRFCDIRQSVASCLLYTSPSPRD